MAADYDWLTGDPGFSGMGFCMTWLRGVSPGEFARRMAARVLGIYAWDALPVPGDDDALLAITDTGRWSLLVEYNGITAIEDDLVRSLSAGTRLVANYCNIEADNYFVVADDGVIVADFDPSYPQPISGSAPDRIRPDMAGLGLGDLSRTDYTEAALVLTERLTGAPLTEELLHGSNFLAATIPDPLR